MIQIVPMRRLLITLFLLSSTLAGWAQPAPEPSGAAGETPAREAPIDAAPAGDAVLADDAVADDTVVEDETIPALVAVGVDAGFPSYQTLSARASVQARFVGAAARIGWGPRSGVYFGGALRAYPPIPGTPVPVWIGGGLGATSAGGTPFAAVGAHVPIAPRWRVDVEAGVAWPELLDERSIAPHLAVGVSYAFNVSLDPSDDDEAGSRDPRVRYAGASCEPTPPDGSALGDALDETVDDFIDDAQATYGSLYDSLRYSVRTRGRDIDGDMATVRVSYSGSVREIATGRRTSASGNAEVRFRWNGCSWNRAGLSY